MFVVINRDPMPGPVKAGEYPIAYLSMMASVPILVVLFAKRRKNAIPFMMMIAFSLIGFYYMYDGAINDVRMSFAVNGTNTTIAPGISYLSYNNKIYLYSNSTNALSLTHFQEFYPWSPETDLSSMTKTFYKLRGLIIVSSMYIFVLIVLICGLYSDDIPQSQPYSTNRSYR
jgi:hypothetical protein